MFEPQHRSVRLPQRRLAAANRTLRASITTAIWSSVLLATFAMAACDGEAFFAFVPNNPVDPDADNYQGYLSVDNPADMALVTANGSVLTFGRLLATAVVGADAYAVQVSSTETFSDASVAYSSETATTNVLYIEGLSAGTYYWRARARKAGEWGPWTEAHQVTLRDPWAASATTTTGTTAGTADAATGLVRNSREFKLTTSTYGETTDWDAMAVEDLGGSGWAVADWNELRTIFGASASEARALAELIGDQNASASVVYNGSKSPSSGRYYFASAHFGTLPSGYLAHSNLQSYMVSLGSWSGSRKILAVRTVDTTAGTTTTTTDPLITPALGSRLGNPQPTLTWAAVDEAATYELQMAATQTAVTTAPTTVVTGTSYQLLTALTDGEQRFWRVRARNASSAVTAWSTTHSFSYADSYADLPADGLIAEYLFTGNANDTSGNTRHGTVTGATLAADRFGTASAAYSFNGSTNHISTPSFTGSWTNGATISVWANKTGNADSRADSTIITRGTNALRLYVVDSTSLPGAWAYAGSTQRTTTSNTPVSGWTHYVLRYRTGFADLFQNGVLASTVTFSGTLNDNGSGWNFGRWTDNTYRWQGAIDDTRIYNRSLTDAEILQLYREGDWQLPVHSPFVRVGTAATLNLGSGSTWDYRHVQGQSILKIGDQYRMWYSGHNGSRWQIGYATSSDGETWTKHTGNPVISNGSSGTVDSSGAHSPKVLHDGTTYRMWYSAYDGSAWTIAYATSTDGVAWTKRPTAVLTAGSSGSFDSAEPHAHAVIKVDDQYVMYYSGYNGSRWQIGRAVSTDGITWTGRSSTPVLGYGSSGAFDSTHALYPSVVVQDGTYHMWYTGRDSTSGPYRIGYASSTDGLTWTKGSANPILGTGPSGAWDRSHAATPAVLFDGDTIRLWYSGYDGSYWRIGEARLVQ